MSERSARQQQQLAALYLDHHRWLLGWFQRRLGDGETAAELMHDAFVKLIGRAEQLTFVREPRAWLTTISHGLLVDHLRRRDLERAYTEAAAALPDALAPDPETRALIMSVLMRIDALLAELAPKARTAFLMSRLEGHSYPDIARHLGVSLPSVEKYMATAIRHCYHMRLKLIQEDLLPDAAAGATGPPTSHE